LVADGVDVTPDVDELEYAARATNFTATTARVKRIYSHPGSMPMTTANLRTRTTTMTAFLATTLVAGAAQAQDPAPAPAADASVTATTPAVDVTATPAAAEPAAAPAAAPVAASGTEQTPWIKRHRPVRNSWEVGIYGGAFLPSKVHEFYRPNLDDPPGFGHQTLKAGFDIGLRGGYYPLSFLGIELEGGLMFNKVADGTRATMYTFRPVVLFQLPYRIAPFIRADFGLLGISSGSLGKDMDPTLGVGGGVKFYLTRRLLLRLDIVDNVATAVGVGNSRSNNLEVLLGLGLRFGTTSAPPKPLVDTDQDGLYDPGQVGVAPADEDACPTQPGPRENRGCPLIDSDGDGMYDPGQGGVAPEDTDACPQEPGPRENKGCPLIDTDKDTLFDPGQPVAATEIDACPNEPGPRELQGCPDRDQDRIIDKIDQCPDQPENYNQFEDANGCPDVRPPDIDKMDGVIKGIYFDVDKDSIKPRSKPVLDRAVAVLKKHPSTRWNIQGHTDSDGTREHNVDLSQRRAESVRKYLVDHGIDSSRLVPQGFGPDAPIDTNATAKGKARNRRIEFRLLD
jgi:outer membrane protein OmpA-like peptidoglycan-associated protein